MSNATVQKATMALVLSALFVGGAAAVLGIVHSTKEIGRPPGCVVKAPDGGMFVAGAYA